MSFRFELHENIATKHHLGQDVHWSQAAMWAFKNATHDKKNMTVCSVKQLDADTVEIIRRADVKPNMRYSKLGWAQSGFYERVTVNRREHTTRIDDMNRDTWQEQPYIGMSDLFYVEQRSAPSSHNGSLTFVRHHYWSFFAKKFFQQSWSSFSARSYKKAFKATPKMAE